ncbi:MAG: serine/threonine-protein kinase [Myxococcota bacterium]
MPNRDGGGDRAGALRREGYRLGARVGEGGVGVVYRAQRTADGVPVAVKVLRPQYARDPVLRARVLREAGALRAVVGPHVGQLKGVGEDPVLGLYLVLAWIDGPSLAARMSAEGPLPLEEAVRLTREVLDGLRCAHEVGVVHRDVKPDNVLLEAGTSARVVDFGIAAFLGDAPTDEDITPSGRRMGTPGYAAPEQIAGDPQRDHRVDLGAAAVLLSEMLAGERPFVARSEDALARAVLLEAPTPLRAHRQGLPPGLEAVLLGALEKDADDRPPTAAAFAEALRPFGDA